jgi:2-aminoadipate transaminase
MMSFPFSQRAQKLTSSAIREILKITENPEVISFAGGIPAPQTFPIEILRGACERIFSGNPHAALQYSTTEGYAPLREWIAHRHGVTAARVLITTGSQQGLDLIGKVLIDSGSPVLVESPTYLGALQAFSLFEPRFITVPCDDISMVPDEISDDMLRGGRFIYTMPNFQNPTGRRMPLDRRLTLANRMRAAHVLIVEDDPYCELSYRGDNPPSLLSMQPDGVIYLGSFSKILAPGLRLGYVIAPEELMKKLVQAKQASDLHASSLDQRMAYEALKTGFLDAHILSIRSLYAGQCAAMLAALAAEMPETVAWNKPEGGMFIWVRLPKTINSTRLLQATLAADNTTRVAFVPGVPFYAERVDDSTMRLSFATVPPERIQEGISQLARVLRLVL